MNKHINYQTIMFNGAPAFVVMPYEEFVRMYPHAKDNDTVPHEVVCLMVKNDISLIRAWREYLGMTQEEVASQLGISQAALSQIEAVKSRPRKQTLHKLAAIYELDVKQLF